MARKMYPSATTSIWILFLIYQVSVAQSDESAAVIVGGYSYGAENGPVIPDVELYGCGEDKPGFINSIQLPPFPRNIYMTSGVYLEKEDKVLVCGGYVCTPRVCGVSFECWSWTVGDLNWVEEPRLVKPRWTHLMAMVPDLNKTSPNLDMVPMVLGLSEETEIFDQDLDEWRTYLDIESRFWMSLGCLTQYGDHIYNMRDRVYDLDPQDWTTSQSAKVPNEHVNTGKCAGVTINGQRGIMNRYGFWYNLETEAWESKSAPPYPRQEDPVNVMWQFRGKPTIFGNRICDGQGQDCRRSGVSQYNPEDDAWHSLGDMLMDRRYQEVIEVPRSVCNRMRPNLVIPRKTAALVIGGYWDNQVLDSVELFGCEYSEESVTLNNYPERSFLTTGTFMHVDGSSSVLSCGGYACSSDNSSDCSITSTCYSWSPADDVWSVDSYMSYYKWALILSFGPNLENNDTASLSPIVLGLDNKTDIYDASTKTWSPYRELEDDNLYSINCAAAYAGYVYFMKENVIAYNLKDWTREDYGPVPSRHVQTGQCAQLRLNGEIGIMTTHGYWFNIHRKRWETKTPPPFYHKLPVPNGLVNFRGKPTIFGNLVPNGNATAWENTAVDQYDPDSDSWVRLGHLKQPREYHTVIEVPGSFCDAFVSTPTTTTTTTTTTTSTLPSTSSTVTVTSSTTTETSTSKSTTTIITTTTTQPTSSTSSTSTSGTTSTTSTTSTTTTTTESTTAGTRDVNKETSFTMFIVLFAISLKFGVGL